MKGGSKDSPRSGASIVTVTANPAVDRSAVCDRVVSERKLRCTDVRRDAGGGGVNVARAVCALGGAAKAVAATGGATGAVLGGLLRAEKVPFREVPVTGETREDVTIFESETGRAYRFNMPGSEMGREEAAELLEAAEEEAPKGGYLVASGSLPPGAPPDLFGKLAEAAARRGARFVLDTSGEPLRMALAAGGLHLLKPNFREIGEHLGRPLGSEEDAARAARELVAHGTADMVLVTLGPGGAVLVTARETVRIASPAVPVRSRIGAGDSTLAGMLVGLARGWEPARAARYAVAAGAAAVMTPGTELCRKEDADALFACIERGTCGWASPRGMNPAEAFE